MHSIFVKMRKNYLYACVLICLILIPFSSYAQTDSLDIYNLDFTQLSNLKITTASKVSEDISKIPSTVFVITESEIKESGYFTLEEALSSLPGFQFRDIQGINSYVFQRGIPNQNNLTLLLVDGVQINELNSGGFYAGGQYNLSNVERIEVVYGPSSVAYGTNAISGIVNIITKNATEKQVKLKALVGSFNTFSSDFNYSYVDEESTFGVVLSGMYKRTSKADLKGKEGDYNWTDLMDNFEKDYAFDLKLQYGNFTFGTNYIQKQSSTATLFKSVGTKYRDYGTSWNIRFINNYLKYNYKLSNQLGFSSIVYNRNATVLDNTIYYIDDTAQVGYYRPNNLTGLESILNYDAGSMLKVTGGLTLEYEQLAEKNSSSFSDSPVHAPPTPSTPKMLNNSLVSIFIEPRIVFSPSLVLTTGMRFDNSSIYDQVVTPRAGLSYNFSNNTFHLSYAEAFRAPKPWDYTDGLGNSALKPERMKSFEASLTLAVQENINLDLIGYSNNLEHAIVKENENNGYKWANSGEVSTEGFEIFIRHISREIKSSINYTFTQSRNELNSFIPEISKHSGNFSLTYAITDLIKFNARAIYIGKRENPKLISTTNSKTIAPSLIFNCTLSFLNFNGFDLQLIIKNVFNAEYYHSSNRDPDRYRQPQRSLMLEVGYSF